MKTTVTKRTIRYQTNPRLWDRTCLPNTAQSQKWINRRKNAEPSKSISSKRHKNDKLRNDTAHTSAPIDTAARPVNIPVRAPKHRTLTHNYHRYAIKQPAAGETVLKTTLSRIYIIANRSLKNYTTAKFHLVTVALRRKPQRTVITVTILYIFTKLYRRDACNGGTGITLHLRQKSIHKHTTAQISHAEL